MISDRDDLSRLIKGRKKGEKVRPLFFPHLKNRWYEIFDEYIKIYGLPVEFTEKQEKLELAYNYKLMFLKTGQQHYITMAESVLSTIENKKVSKRNFSDVIADTCISIGFHMDKRQFSAKEFFDIEKRSREINNSK